MFRVRRHQCSTCIYKPCSPLDLGKLEGEIADGFGGFTSHRTCHHTSGPGAACCAGFWARHKGSFAAGQVAQRLGMVQLVDTDDFEGQQCGESESEAAK